MSYFNLEDRYEDVESVGGALNRRDGVVLSVVVHVVMALLILFMPPLTFLRHAAPSQLQLLQQQAQQKEQRTFVFVQPKLDLDAAKPPPRAEDSDKDRMARTREKPPNPISPLPYSRGNSPDRVEAQQMERARGRGPEPEATVARAEQQANSPDAMQRLPDSPNGVFARQQQPNTGRSGGALGEALKNLQKYVQNQSFDNPTGGQGEFGPFIQFDTKGVEFGPWIRRFIAQIKRNWFIPYAAMSLKGHVVLQFNVHMDGSISDVAVVQPAGTDAFNNAAYNAIISSNPTQPLPPEYPSDKAFFTVTFFYNESPQ